MKKLGGELFRIGAALSLILAVFFLFVPDATSKTVVQKTGECIRVVWLNLELHSGGPRWSDEELNRMSDKQKKRLKDYMDNYSSYSDADLAKIGAEWKAEVERTWNGPTEEQVNSLAEDAGFSSDDIAAAAGGDWDKKNKIHDAVAKELEKYGGSPDSVNCTEINCCQIYFKVRIKVRKYSDPTDPDYHQIRVMKTGYRSNVSTHSDGLHANHKGTSGSWAYDPNNPWDASAGHECGHLMGLDDQYTDEHGTNKGHEHDIMGVSYGYPREEALQEILTAGGAPCDCCPKTTDGISQFESYYEDYGMTVLVAGDAIITKNCPHLKATKTKLGNMLKDMALNRGLSVSARADLVSKINSQLKRINKALEDCDKPSADETGTGIKVGEDTIPYAPFSFDSLQCTTFGGGTVPIPIPEGYGPGFPVFPTGPTKGPASTPGQTPAGDTKDPSNPLVPFDKFEYDENDTVIRDGIDLEGYDGNIEIPYDDWDYTFADPDIIEGNIEDGDIEPPTIELVPGDEDDDEEPKGVTTQEDDKTTTVAPPTWLIFKAEQDVVQQDGSIGKGPAEKSVLKLGFPPPPTPTPNGTRTAEQTNDSADKEPQFVETDEDGWGKIKIEFEDPIFTDGFESGDISRWGAITPAGGEKKKPAPRVTGYTLDATPTKSRIVYLEGPGLETVDDRSDFYGSLDDLNGNGIPDWAEIGEAIKDPNAAQALQEGGLLKEGPVKDEKSRNPAQPGPNIPEGGGSQTELPENLKGFESDRVQFGYTVGVTLTYKFWQEDQILAGLNDYVHQYNRYEKEKLDDPYFNSEGTWGQPYDDQWAIKSVGFTGEAGDAWDIAGDDIEPVIIAFIDSGIDWNHADISWDNIWMNPGEIPDNGIDDDMNGYIDDIIGWDFYTNNASPWDQDGHGTFTAGMIIAKQNNGVGIAGINPKAKIMVLKALNDFGHTRASYVAKAIKYAVDNGAKIINLSIGGEHQTYLERLAISYAHQNGVLVIVAAGNESTEITTYGFAPYEEVIAVASSDFEGKRVFFSNLGPEIDIAAPGLDVLSLRARMTDFMRHVTGVRYEAGSSYVGEDRRYFRSSGTSFSVPIVTGIASLIWGKNPDLSAEEVKRMLLQTAIDVELPGHDQFTGYGVVDAIAALQADPAFEIVADIAAVNAIQDSEGNFFVKVDGTASANDFDAASIQIGIGETPREFKEVARLGAEVEEGQLALIPAAEFMSAPTWTIRVVVHHKNGKTREERFVLQLG